MYVSSNQRCLLYRCFVFYTEVYFKSENKATLIAFTMSRGVLFEEYIGESKGGRKILCEDIKEKKSFTLNHYHLTNIFQSY